MKGLETLAFSRSKTSSNSICVLLLATAPPSEKQQQPTKLFSFSFSSPPQLPFYFSIENKFCGIKKKKCLFEKGGLFI